MILIYERACRYFYKIAKLSLRAELDHTMISLIYKLAKNKKANGYECEFAFSVKNNLSFVEKCEKAGIKVVVKKVYNTKDNEIGIISASCSYDNKYLKEIEERNNETGVSEYDVEKVIDTVSLIDKLLLSEAEAANYEISYNINSNLTEYIVKRYESRGFDVELNKNIQDGVDEIKISYIDCH